MGVSKRGTRKSTDKFKSNLERKVDVALKAAKLKFDYEPYKISYIQPEQKRTYLPDFCKGKVILEAKGRLTSADRKKMLLLQEQHPEHQYLMIFGQPQNKLSKKSNTTYAMWCENNNIAWCDIARFEENPKLCLSNIQKKPLLGTLSTLLKKNKKPSST